MDTKTGEIYWRDEDGVLWLAETFVKANGVTYTTQTQVEE